MKKPCTRAFADASDIQKICSVVANARPIALRGDYASEKDLREMLPRREIQNNTRLWEDKRGEVVAYALVDDFNNLCFDILPHARNETLDAEIFAWGADCIRRRNAANHTNNTLDAVTRAEDLERVAWLEQFGFARQPIETIKMVRALNEPIAPPKLPSGFTIRAVAGEHEAEALAALHRAAFGTEHTTTEKRLTWMHTPDYDAALDLAVVAPGGSFAASCMGSVNDNVGSLDPLATHPNYQRRGLARALLLYGAQLLRERGMEYAELGTSSENIAMQRAAFAAGFHIESKRVWYSRTIEEN